MSAPSLRIYEIAACVASTIKVNNEIMQLHYPGEAGESLDVMVNVKDRKIVAAHYKNGARDFGDISVQNKIRTLLHTCVAPYMEVYLSRAAATAGL